jgi:hypothetical protein
VSYTGRARHPAPEHTAPERPRNARLDIAALVVALVVALIAMGWGTAVCAENVPAHGLWVWKAPAVANAPRGAETLRDFCQSEGIDEVYLSASNHGDMSGLDRLSHLIELLHQSDIRVEALLSSDNADQSGMHRDKLLDHVRDIVHYNRAHPQNRFDGIHLDIEPQQRPENKGSGNLRFLPGLVQAYQAVRGLAEPAGLTVNADIQNGLLKGSVAERRMLLSSMPRLTLMLYELSSPNDGESIEAKAEKLQAASRQFLDMAYADLHDPNLATMMIGLRTPDYGQLLPKMLTTLDESNRTDPHYQGWAWHAYNDAE